MELKKLTSLFLPEGFLEHFNAVEYREASGLEYKKQEIHIWLDEMNHAPEGYGSKGLLKEKVIQDFPIRGKAVFLHIRRRRWRHKKREKPDIKSNYYFIAQAV